MSEKQFRVRFEQEDGKGEIVDEKGVELTAREVVDLLNGFCDEIRVCEGLIDDQHTLIMKLNEKIEKLEELLLIRKISSKYVDR